MENLACTNICLAVRVAKVVKKILNFDWIGMSEAEFLKAGSTNPPTFDPGLRCYITIRLRKLLIDPMSFWIFGLKTVTTEWNVLY